MAVCSLHAALSDVGGAGTANLVNTCSYPSEQPNSDPSDCVLIPRDAFIQIDKDATPDTRDRSRSRSMVPRRGLVFPTTSNNTATGMRPAHHRRGQERYALAQRSGARAHGLGSDQRELYGRQRHRHEQRVADRDTISGIIAAPDNTVTARSTTAAGVGRPLEVRERHGSQTGAVFTLYNGLGHDRQAVVGTCTVIDSGHCDSSSPPTTSSFANSSRARTRSTRRRSRRATTSQRACRETVAVIAGQANGVVHRPGAAWIGDDHEGR